MDDEPVSTEASISRILDRSKELETEDQRHSSDDEGWGESDVAPGQQLSDYRSEYHPLPSTQPASMITESDSGPLPNTLRTHVPKDVRAVAGDSALWCGLQNLGNSCYMNAGLQCLSSLKQFAAHFLAAVPAQDDDEDKSSHAKKHVVLRAQLNSSFSVLMRKLWCGQFLSVHPKVFKMCLGLLHSPFTGSRQQDCQEFLAVLLDNLHEHLMDGHTPLSETVVSETFQGQLKNVVECVKCGHASTKLEPFVYLSLPLPGAHQRQIEVYWVPATIHCNSHLKVMRLLVTVMKQDSILELKMAVCELIGRTIDKDLLVLAEVIQGYISRPLGNSIAVKQLSFSKGQKLYCYEMLPLSQLTASLHTSDPWSPNPQPAGTMPPNPQPAGTMPTNPWPPTSDLSEEQDPLKMSEDYDAFGSEPFVPDSGRKEATAVVMEWRTCSVCLEEMLDTDLLVHPECGGVLCSPCLQSSIEHFSNSNSQMPCPICSVNVSPSTAFSSLSSSAQTHTHDQQKLISFLQVVLLTRDDEGKLFGHPVITHLPCEASGSLYYNAVSSLLPEPLAKLQWSLCLTDAKSRYCSRCAFDTFCSGCPLQRSTGSQVSLKPGDHLTVSFTAPLNPNHLTLANAVTDHSSFLRAFSNQNLTLKECLQAFAKSEQLADDNPWFCSACDSQQKAVRTLNVSQIPPVLIVHLKRFMYHSGGSKLEIPVEFPMELEAKEVCPDTPIDAPPLKLVAMVCHFGTLQGGHYTAFVRSPSTGSWIYCNDSQLSHVSPSSKETESVYILFYEHQSQNIDFDLLQMKSVNCNFDDEVEMKKMEGLMLSNDASNKPNYVKNQTQLKRTNSNPDIQKSLPPAKPHRRQCNMSPF